MSTVEAVPQPGVRYYFRPWVTQILVGVNVAIYLAMVAHGKSAADFTTALSLRWGADYGPLTFGGQPWRVWTSNYVHGGFLHILFNMWCLWNLGALAERIFGRWTMLATYTACGIGASLASLWWNPMRISVGASGAIFGLAGAAITAIYLGKLPFPKEALRGISRSLITFAGYNLLFGFLPGIDNSAHVGGLITGLALGAVLAPFLAQPVERRVQAERVIFVAVAFLLLGAGIFLKRTKSYVVPLGHAMEALRTQQPARALPDLEAAARMRPKDLRIANLLGATYIQLKNYPQAEAALKHVLELDPSDRTAQFNLGMLYGTTGRFEEARLVFADLTQRDPKNDDAWLMLGSALKGLNQPANAQAALQKALQLNPKNYEAYRELGWVQLQQEQPDAALQSFKRALDLNRKDPGATLGLGRAYMAKHMAKEAAEALERYRTLRSGPDDNPEDDQLIVTP